MVDPTTPPLAAPAALYAQIITQISEEIRSGALRPGDRLPPERELAVRFSVSRVTIRRALAELSEAGLVQAKQGQGTFVSPRVVGETSTTLMSFSELGRARGLQPTAHVLAHETRPATLDEAESFDVAPGTPIFILERLRLLDGMPISIDTSRIPLIHAPGLETIDFSTRSLYDSLDHVGAAPVRADYTVRAETATATQASLLGLAEGAAVLHTRTASHDRADRVVELGRMIYRGDRYQFQATLWRSRD